MTGPLSHPVSMQNAERRRRHRDRLRDRDLRAVPSRLQTDADFLQLEIIDGNTLYSGSPAHIYGVKKAFGLITDLTTDYDPDVSTTPGTFSAIDGIGRAFLWRNMVKEATPVLVVLDARSHIQKAIIETEPQNCFGAVMIQNVSSGSWFPCYVPRY